MIHGLMVLDRMHQQNITVQAIIITHADERKLSDYIMQQLKRGVTYWSGTGAYTGETVHVLCVCLSKYEIEELRHAVHSFDPHEFDLEVDTNQANENQVTIFVNFRVVGSDGRLLGVIGVGLQVNFIEDTTHSYERNYGMSAYIINVGGAKNSFTGDSDIFIREDELPKRTGIQEAIKLNQSNAPEMQWFTSGSERKCLISQYNETLGWYLVLEKNTSSMNSAF